MTYKRGQDGQVKRKALFYAPCAYLWKWANKGTSKGCFTCLFVLYLPMMPNKYKPLYLLYFLFTCPFKKFIIEKLLLVRLLKKIEYFLKVTDCNI